MSRLMRSYLAGLLAHAGEITWFLAPYVNSYKRFTAGTFAPTKAIWSHRQPHRRLPAGRRGQRRRCASSAGSAAPTSTPTSPMPALLAAGIAGIERKLELEPEFRGDAYRAARVREIPRTLRDATEALRRSKMLRAALGDDVVEHYVHAAPLGAGRMRPPGHRLGNRARLRAGVMETATLPKARDLGTTWPDSVYGS